LASGPGGQDDGRSDDRGDGEGASKPRRQRAALSPYERAVGLLARREHSRRELERKLVAKGVEAGEAHDAVERLAGQGWQDEQRFAESLARSRAMSGYGPVRIRAELGTHDIPTHVIDAALDELESGHDWREAARELLQRRLGEVAPADPARRRKAQSLLLRRGFDSETVYSLTSGRESS
jgi:regulatory protein